MSSVLRAARGEGSGAHLASGLRTGGRGAALAGAVCLAALGACAAPDRPPGSAGPGLYGVLADEAGTPLAHSEVLACMETTCLYGRTDAAGRFAFAIEPPARIALKTQSAPWATPRLSSALCPVRVEGAEPVDVGTVHVPSLGEGVVPPPGQESVTAVLGDGLEATFRPGDLRPIAGQTLVEVAADRVPDGGICELLRTRELEGEEIVAAYALHPFGATSSSSVAVRIEIDLPAGTPVRFRTISEIDGVLSEPVPGEADGTHAVTRPGEGILEWTWLVVSR